MYLALCNPEGAPVPAAQPEEEMSRSDATVETKKGNLMFLAENHYFKGWLLLLRMMPGCPYKHPHIMPCSSGLHTCCPQDRDPRPKIGAAALMRISPGLRMSLIWKCLSLHPSACPPHSALGPRDRHSISLFPVQLSWGLLLHPLSIPGHVVGSR